MTTTKTDTTITEEEKKLKQEEAAGAAGRDAPVHQELHEAHGSQEVAAGGFPVDGGVIHRTPGHGHRRGSGRGSTASQAHLAGDQVRLLHLPQALLQLPVRPDAALQRHPHAAAAVAVHRVDEPVDGAAGFHRGQFQFDRDSDWWNRGHGS